MLHRLVVLTLALGLPCSAAWSACTAVDGWQDGRAGKGRSDGCAEAEYVEAHRLGASLHELEVEYRDIARKLEAVPGVDAGVKQRRQRQLDNDIEAIRGVATIKGWPLDPVSGDKS